MCRRLGIKFALENPNSSILWCLDLSPGKEAPREYTVRVDVCQFGAPWRKAIRLLTNDARLQQVAATCRMRDNLCCRTALSHHRLEGKSPSGRWWTAIAEPYPRKFCTSVADALSGLL